MKELVQALSALCIVVIASSASAQDGQLAGPHLDGNAYAGLRSTEPQDAVFFRVSTVSQKTSSQRNVIVGPDYVLERSDDAFLLYDFRFRRLLTIDPSAQSFTNASLYGHTLTRFTFLQNHLGTAGVGIAMGLFDPSLGSAIRFVNEHFNGISFPRPVAAKHLTAPTLQITRKGQTLTGILGSTEILSVMLSSVPFPSKAHSKTFRAWLTWSGPVHPQTANVISETGRFPSRITTKFPTEFLKMDPSRSPKHELVFEELSVRPHQLNVLNGLKSSPPTWSPYLPTSLAQLMVNAARGTAAGGPVPDSKYIADIKKLSDSGRHLDAVLLSLHASHPYDGCQGQQREHEICKSLTDAINKGREDQNVRRFFAGVIADGNKKHRQALQILTPLRGLDLSRPDILEFTITNALVEAKKSSQLDEKLAAEFEKLPQTYERILSVDPYDPARYRDIFNYLYAAASSIPEHYQVRTSAQAVIDLAQALPNRRMPIIITQLNDSNERIAQDFSILLPVFDQR